MVQVFTSIEYLNAWLLHCLFAVLCLKDNHIEWLEIIWLSTNQTQTSHSSWFLYTFTLMLSRKTNSSHFIAVEKTSGQRLRSNSTCHHHWISMSLRVTSVCSSRRSRHSRWYYTWQCLKSTTIYRLPKHLFAFLYLVVVITTEITSLARLSTTSAYYCCYFILSWMLSQQ